MIKVITLNLNGIRSATKKGFFKWVLKQNADVICLQETKAQEHQLSEKILSPKGYAAYFFDAKKKGYSGVALYLKKKPKNIITGFGWKRAYNEGRYLQADYDNISVISLYMPSGTSGPHRQKIKFQFMKHFMKHLKKLRKQKRQTIICGDWNIAHKNIDLKNWRSNQKNSGFLPEEREWLDKVFDSVGYVDAFRFVNPLPDQYTWWSHRSKTARAKNVGWRIDYQIITPGLKKHVKSAKIYKRKYFSDHAPLIMEYNILL